MAQTVRVRLRKPPRVFTFSVNDVELDRNDTCVVNTDRGVEFGVCIAPPESAVDGAEQRMDMSVVRKASHHDETTFKQISLDEQRALRLCRDKVNARKLPMRMVETEYTFDRKKIIFYFTADDRVDFRELVKDLAFEMKARIELRHIQVRDQAKMVGGIGTCGRELCCTTWMREFMPISMKMAKKQNLSLNPTKISGQCGRLMCCLAYENEMYDSQRRERKPMPEDLESIRDEMESNQRDAVDAIAHSEETDVLDALGPDDERTAAPGDFERPAGTPSRDEEDGNARKRRRGRRGGRGRNKRDDAG